SFWLFTFLRHFGHVIVPGGVDAVPFHQPLSVIKPETKTAEISCSEASSSYIHWYRHRDGEAPTRILYLDSSNDNVNRDSGFSAAKYESLKPGNNKYILKIHTAEESDSGMYYCARWDTHSVTVPLGPCTKTPTCCL
uniref:Ig-like domain-containing protein n=1 Tax=Latimeria chalumnae TaxID=7897 RepID=H3AD37_LATCH